MRKRFKGAYIANNGYDFELATKVLAANEADLIAFGKPFLANPDLVERLKRGAPLNTPDKATFYGGGAKGYTDYPALGEVIGCRAIEPAQAASLRHLRGEQPRLERQADIDSRLHGRLRRYARKRSERSPLHFIQSSIAAISAADNRNPSLERRQTISSAVRAHSTDIRYLTSRSVRSAPKDRPRSAIDLASPSSLRARVP